MSGERERGLGLRAADVAARRPRVVRARASLQGQRHGERHRRRHPACHHRLPNDGFGRPLDDPLGTAGGPRLFRQPGWWKSARSPLMAAAPATAAGAAMSEHAYRQCPRCRRPSASPTAARSTYCAIGGGGPRRSGPSCQAAFAGACAEFYTVLGPGSDAYHANHFHLDLLRTNARNGRHYCQPSPYGGAPVAQLPGQRQRRGCGRDATVVHRLAGREALLKRRNFLLHCCRLNASQLQHSPLSF